MRPRRKIITRLRDEAMFESLANFDKFREEDLENLPLTEHNEGKQVR